jgi:hypothetical protein
MRRTINLILICACVAIAAPREEYKRDFSKSVTLGGGKSFRIENSLGNIIIHTHAGSDAAIHATIRCSAENATAAKECADRIQITVDEGASGVSVRTIYPRNEGRRNMSYGVEYDLTLPETTPLDLRNRFGRVDVTRLGGPANINNGNGTVIFTGGRGQQRIENSFGDVEVRGNTGDVTVLNGNGNVTANDVTGTVDITNRFGGVRVTNAGRGLTVRSNNGNIEATNIGGVATISNTFGRVFVSEAKGDVTVRNQNGAVDVTGVAGAAILETTFNSIRFSRVGKGVTVHATNSQITGDTVAESAIVETTFGGVDLREVKGGARVTAGNSSIRLAGIGGDAYAKTTFNGVTIADVAGPVTVENQNGSVTVEARRGPKCQPISLRTSFGPIRMTVPSGSGYNLTARTSFGRIHSDAEISVTGDVSPDALTGKIGGGGCELRLMGQNGNIDILKK